MTVNTIFWEDQIIGKKKERQDTTLFFLLINYLIILKHVFTVMICHDPRCLCRWCNSLKINTLGKVNEKKKNERGIYFRNSQRGGGTAVRGTEACACHAPGRVFKKEPEFSHQTKKAFGRRGLI